MRCLVNMGGSIILDVILVISGWCLLRFRSLFFTFATINGSSVDLVSYGN